MRHFYPSMILLLALISMELAIGQTENSRPNIIVILADDLGYGDVGFNRDSSYPAELGIIPTPNIDALANNGIIGTNAHVAHPFCGPSRTAILTGMYPHRIGAQYNLPNDISTNLGIPESETYFSKVIDDASYNTMAVGKWHLGFEEGKYQPMDRGFDEFFGFLGGGKNYFRSEYDRVWYKYRTDEPEYNDPALYNEPKDNHTTNEYQNPLRRGRDYVDRKEFGLEEYLTDILTDQAIDFIDRKATDADPFFIYLSYNAPHTPLQAPQSEIDAFKAANPDFEGLVSNSNYIRQSRPVTKLPAEEQDSMVQVLTQNRITYATMVSNMDTNIGRVVEKLNEKNILNNTLIVFLSDNGGYRFTKGAVNYPLDAQKGSVDEGGHRVPFFVHWPEKIQSPSTYEYQISALDLYPTLASVAGGTIPENKKIDGLNFMDKLLAGENARPEDPLYVLRPQNGFHNAAVISYPYRMTKKGGSGSWKLFDANVNPEVQLSGNIEDQTTEEIINNLEAKGAAWSKEFFDVKPAWFDHERNGGHPHRILWFGEDLAGNTGEEVFADYDITFNYEAHTDNLYPHTDRENTQNWILKESMSDEFEGDVLDEDKWLIQGRNGEYRSNFVGRAPWQYSTDNVRLEDGKLKIQTRYEPEHEWVNPGDDEYKYTTAGISTKETLFEGYMEIKCKLPVEYVTGAFWTTGEPGVGSELDIFEAVGKGQRQNLMWSTIHDWKIPLPNKVWTETSELPFSYSDGYHIYSAEWGNDVVKFYADGELIHETSRSWVEENGIDSKRWPLVGGQHLWVDSEIFPWWGEPDSNNLPVDYEVEYVRVWEKEKTSEPTSGYDFENPFELLDGSFEDWFIPSFSQPYYSISSEKPYEGNNSLKFAHTGTLENNAVIFAPFGSLQLETGDYIMSAKVLIEEGSTATVIRPILEEPWAALPVIDISELPTNEWTTIYLPFTRSEVSGAKDRLRLLIRPTDTDEGSSTVFIDNIEFNKDIPVTGVSVAPEIFTISVGETYQLEASIEPADAGKPAVTWSSSNEQIATVDANGLVTAVNEGEATITATTDDGGFTTSAQANITSFKATTTIYDFEGPIELDDGTTENWFIPPASQQYYSITSEKVYEGEKALKFSHSGILENNALAFAPFGTLKLDSGDQILRLKIWVDEGSTKTTIRPILESPWTLITPIEITDLPTNQWNTVEIPFTRSDISGDDDRIRFLIRPTDTDDQSSTFYIDYVEFDTKKAVESVTGVQLDPETASLLVGESTELSAMIQPANATDQSVTWLSLDENIATVDENGTVTAIGPGTISITVETTDGGFTDSASITVTQPVTGISIDPTTYSINIRETIKLNAVVQPENATNQNVNWSTDNSKIADVDDSGNVTGMSCGTAAITATTQEGSYSTSATITVKEVIPFGQKIWLKANSGYFLRLSNKGKLIEANAAEESSREYFEVVDAGDNLIALRSTSNGKLLEVLKQKSNTIKANSNKITEYETFTWECQGLNKVSFKSMFNRLYATIDPQFTNLTLRANSKSIGDWETFTWGIAETSMSDEKATGKMDKFNLSIYPNPITENMLNINSFGLNITKISLINFQGETLTSRPVNDASELKINLSDLTLKTGVYFVRFETDKGVYVKKLIVKR